MCTSTLYLENYWCELIIVRNKTQKIQTGYYIGKTQQGKVQKGQAGRGQGEGKSQVGER